MTRTEERLRDALHVRARAVRDDEVRPLAEPGTSAGRRRGWLAPLAAAVAVALVAVLAVTLTSGQRGTSSRPVGPATPAPAQTATPQFFTEADGTSLQVRSVATGKLIGQLPGSVLNRIGFQQIAAAPDGRTFYLVGLMPRLHALPRDMIYTFTITGAGTVTPLRLVARGPFANLGEGDQQNIAVSPDGTELAFTTYIGSSFYDQVATIVVVDLRTGEYHLWRGGLRHIRARIYYLVLWDLSWSGTGTLDFVASWCGSDDWLYCGSGSAQLRELAIGPDGGSLAGSATLTDLGRFPDLVGVVADQQGHLTIMQVSPRGKGKVREQVTIDQVAATSGAVRVLYRHSFPWTGSNAPYGAVCGPMLSDPSGQYLMVWGLGITSGWLHDGTLQRLPANPPYPYPLGFAW
jgi:hypothetical protein